jgi:hypothetical protein
MGRATGAIGAMALGWSVACAGDDGSEAPAAPAWTLVSVTAGDASCYLEVRGADGASRTLPGDFELCPGGGQDASALVGERVAVDTRPGQVMAASCQGDPECPDHDAVALVVKLTPSP